MVLQVELVQEKDGRWIAEVADLPGVMVYGPTAEAALLRVQALVLRVVADPLETWGARPRATQYLFQGRVSDWPSTRARKVLVALLRPA